MLESECVKGTLVTIGEAKLDWTILSDVPLTGWGEFVGKKVVTLASGNGGRVVVEPIDNIKPWRPR